VSDDPARRPTLTGLQVLRLGLVRRSRQLWSWVVDTVGALWPSLLHWMLDLDRPAWVRRLARALRSDDGSAGPRVSARDRRAIAAFKTARAVTPPPQPRALGADLRPGKQRILGEDQELQRQVSEGLAAPQANFQRKKGARQLDGPAKKP
jgi:hypothetical protein